MSYVVHLWEHAAPDTLKAAQALHERLSAMPPPPGNKFGALAQALIQRFPVEVGGAAPSSDAEGGEPAEWVESVPDGNSPGAVYSLAVYGDGIDRLLPFLIDTANALGLTVYDDQAGQVFLPGGWVLDEGGRSVRASVQAEPPATGPLTPALAKAALKEFATAHLKPLGFTCKVDRFGATLRRKTPVGEQVLTIMLADAAGVRISLAAELVANLPPSLAEIVKPQTSIYLALGPCVALRAFAVPVAGDDPWPTFDVAHSDDLRQWLHGYEDMVRTELLPLLDACRTAAGILECDLHGERYVARLKPSLVTLALLRCSGISQTDWQRRVDEYNSRRDHEYRGWVNEQAWLLRRAQQEGPRIAALAACDSQGVVS